MNSPNAATRLWVMLILLASVVTASNGCSRIKYRLQADRDAYDAITEHVDPRLRADNYSIELDPRSRYYDPYDPDRPPMPLDDPVSHQYMRMVDGKKGWKHWQDNGHRTDLENPSWYASLAEYATVGPDGAVKLDVDSALKIAYMNSPSNQTLLETLYLSALDVTAERFRLDTQFFGGYNSNYLHNGKLIPPAVRFEPTLGRYVVNPAITGPGIENNNLSLGRPFAANPVLSAERRFATAGELLVGFANSFVVEFTGDDANLASSLANFSLVQPLLRGAGRDVALEQLTFVERTLLANLRAYNQYRQGFYTQVAIGELGVAGPQRFGRSTDVQVFSGQGGVGGYHGLLQQLQEIRNSEGNLNLQLRTLAQLDSLRQVGVIDLVQVDRFRQNVENERSNLLLRQNNFALSLDRYKTTTLGLPPDLLIELDDRPIRQFQLIDRNATSIQDAVADMQDRLGRLPPDAPAESIRQFLVEADSFIQPVGQQLTAVEADLVHMYESLPDREQSIKDEDRIRLQQDRERLTKTLVDLQAQFGEIVAELEAIQLALSEQNRRPTARRLVVWLGRVLRLIQRSTLVQARARLESVTVEAITLDARDAFHIALENRIDFMNARAALVDEWRRIQFRADALQSVVNVTASGEMRTARNNPVSFRAPTTNLQLGLEFDAPFTRLLERNEYRETLIEYQRSRRALIQSRDSLQLGLRTLLRQIELLRENLEIQRRAVAIAIRRVDLTRAALYAPVPPPQPGQPAAQFGPTAAFDLLSAQTDLRDTQNSFLRVWLNYYADKMRLARELGIMELDQDGRWIDRSLQGTVGEGPSSEQLPLPPAAPGAWLPPPAPAQAQQQPIYRPARG